MPDVPSPSPPTPVTRALLTALLLLLTPLTAGAADLCLDWPLGKQAAGQMVPGYGIHVQQNYANTTHPTYGPRAHAAVDLQYSGVANAGLPVYAAADGVVRYTTTCCYPGGVVVIEHGSSSGTVYTQYGHLGSVWVGTDQPVSRGQQIGTILDQGGNSHLHFEVRDWLQYPATGSYAGPGYASGTNHPSVEGWRDPVAEIYGHRPPFPGTAKFDTARNVRSGPSTAYGLVGSVAAGAQPAVDAVSPDGGHWWYRINHSGSSWGWANVFWKGSYGSGIYAGELQRACGGSGASVDAAGSSVPSSVATSSTTRVTVRVDNTGTSTWRTGTPVRLGTLGANDFVWRGFACGGYMNAVTDGRAELCHDVAPGTSHDFQFDVKAPPEPGTYQLSVQMVEDGVAWFGNGHDFSLSVTGTTCACSGGTTYWGSSIPSGDTYCGFRVCGLDDQVYQCNSWGWGSVGQFSCSGCQCAGGKDYLGNPIDPEYTYCGFEVCGMDLQVYRCDAGGWAATGTSCP